MQSKKSKLKSTPQSKQLKVQIQRLHEHDKHFDDWYDWSMSALAVKLNDNKKEQSRVENTQRALLSEGLFNPKARDKNLQTKDHFTQTTESSDTDNDSREVITTAYLS